MRKLLALLVVALLALPVLFWPSESYAPGSGMGALGDYTFYNFWAYHDMADNTTINLRAYDLGTTYSYFEGIWSVTWVGMNDSAFIWCGYLDHTTGAKTADSIGVWVWEPGIEFGGVFKGDSLSLFVQDTGASNTIYIEAIGNKWVDRFGK